MTRRSSDPISSNPSGCTTSTRKGSSATTSLTPTATTAWRAFPSCSVFGLSCLWRLLTWVSLGDLHSLLVPRRLPYQPVPQVGAHGYPAGLCRLAPGVGCDPLQRAPRHPSREPLRHLLLHHRGVLEPSTGSHPLLRAGGASDPALRPRYRSQAQVREGRNPRRVTCSGSQALCSTS